MKKIDLSGIKYRLYKFFYDFPLRWWFNHRFVPKHRYNIIRTGLPPGYYDPDDQLLHGIFNTFCEWYENDHHLMGRNEEEIDEMCTPHFEGDTFGKEMYESRKQEYEDLKKAYLWWTKTAKKDFNKLIKDACYKRINDSLIYDYRLEEALEKEATDMLILVIKYRRSLWY